MTKQEFMDKYGDVEVKFSSYYKYTFTFIGEFDGGVVLVEVGGGSSDIYRMEVCSGLSESVRGLDPYSGTFAKRGEVDDNFYEQY
jgi:hypothetical protein